MVVVVVVVVVVDPSCERGVPHAGYQAELECCQGGAHWEEDADQNKNKTINKQNITSQYGIEKLET